MESKPPQRNNRLKQIWLDNDLDEEMIFSSWIGPSQALLRQNVSDYLQTFLLRRAQHVPHSNAGIFSMLRRLNNIRDSEELSNALRPEKDSHPYYNLFIESNLNKRYKLREKQEKVRVAKSIAKGDLQTIPGFEYIVKNPVFKAQQLENRLRKLSKLPLPYNEKEFEAHILPIMTALAITKEKLRNQGKLTSINLISEQRINPSSEHPLHSLSSGFSEGFGSSLSEDAIEIDSELIQVFSEMDLKTDPNDTLSDVCEVCGGLVSCEVNSRVDCSCVSDPVWGGKSEQTASALYEDASKIVQLYIREHDICSEYMERYESTSWIAKLT